MDIGYKYQTEKQIIEAIENYNSRLDTEISENDGMFFGEKETYFFQTRSAFECIIDALRMHTECNVESILDFACGHGRVMRALRAAFPKSEIVASDSNADGVNYCVKKFDAIGVMSGENPDSINFDNRKFDLIWVGSLLTHLDRKNSKLFYNLFRKLLNENGILICTFHGRFSIGRLNGEIGYGDVSKRRIKIGHKLFGYGYSDYSASKNYGISICNPSWIVKELVEPNDDLTMLYHRERGWDLHQDVLAVTKSPILVPHIIQKKRWGI